MGHDWVFDVLDDLKSYAVANGLHRLAAKTDEVIKIAAEEIGALDPVAVALWTGKGFKAH